MPGNNITTPFSNEGDQKQKKPVIFAGSIFYRHIHDSLKLAQGAMLTRNFEQWTVILMDLDTKLSPFYFIETQEELTEEKIKENKQKGQTLSTSIEADLKLCLKRILNNGDQKDRQVEGFLLGKLLDVQKRIFSASSAMFMGMNEKEDSEFERDQEDGG